MLGASFAHACCRSSIKNQKIKKKNYIRHASGTKIDFCAYGIV
jgi:hypothetical protein